MPKVPLDLHYVDELIAQRKVQHGGYQGAPPIVNGYRQGESLNRSCIVMLSAQLQTYVEEVFLKVSRRVLPALDADVEFYKSTFSRWGNPSAANINNLFARIGVMKVLAGLKWQNCAEAVVLAKLESLNQIRNGIAHGHKTLHVNKKPVSLALSQVSNYRDFCSVFAYNFEGHARHRALNP